MKVVSKLSVVVSQYSNILFFLHVPPAPLSLTGISPPPTLNPPDFKWISRNVNCDQTILPTPFTSQTHHQQPLGDNKQLKRMHMHSLTLEWVGKKR